MFFNTWSFGSSLIVIKQAGTFGLSIINLHLRLIIYDFLNLMSNATNLLTSRIYQHGACLLFLHYLTVVHLAVLMYYLNLQVDKIWMKWKAWNRTLHLVHKELQFNFEFLNKSKPPHIGIDGSISIPLYYHTVCTATTASIQFQAHVILSVDNCQLLLGSMQVARIAFTDKTTQLCP